MAYNSYFPAGYQGYYNPYQQAGFQQPMQQAQQQMPLVNQPTQQTNSNSLTWVQGEAGAKSFMVAPNNTVMLMDSESDRFYLKSSDASGMPLPLRIFRYQEVTAQNTTRSDVSTQTINNADYVTKAEFDAFKDEMNAFMAAPKQTTTKTKKKEDVENG
jgi:hypothetical protein